MKLIIDTHTHTISSGHGYSTLKENIDYCRKIGLRGLAVTDHGPKMEGGAVELHFLNLKSLPREDDGVLIYRSAELNILNELGEVDLEDKILESLDFAIASLHLDCFKHRDKKSITQALIKAMEHNKVKIIGHLCDPRLEFDMNEIVKHAKINNVAIEVNNSSLNPNMRRYNREEYLKLIRLCSENDVGVVLSSDSHYYKSIGDVKQSIELVKESGIDENLILNIDIDRFNKFINLKM